MIILKSLLSPINHFLDYSAWFVFETEYQINSGLGFGAKANSPVLKEMLVYYVKRKYVIDGKFDMELCPKANTDCLEKTLKNFTRNGQTQILNNILIVSCADYASVAVHHATTTWQEGAYNESKQPYKDTKLKRFLRKEKKFTFVQKHFGKKE
ncbi:MAG: hypothetical protein LUF33_01955 [Clostridiales bacterium]|nr:hypothetical protein [Clostridiales bacterium]